MFISTTRTNLSQGVRIVNLLLKSSLSLKKKLTHFLLITIAILITSTLSATNYYVSSSGNDSNAGTSESTPWKTLTKVNSFTPKPGDQILFKRGDEWSGSITVKASGTSSSRITYGAYGTGNKPKIYGSEKITGWTQYSGNIYKANFNTNINQLFVNDLRMKIARYPNTGYAFINTVNSTKSFTCDALNGSLNYSGAIWIGRTIAYSIVTLDVVSSTSNTLTLSEVPYANLNTKEGFILVNKLEFLDSSGEWYYDINTRTVYLWTPNGDTPSNYIVSGSTFENGIVATGKDYITIRDLEILNNKSKGITFSGNYVTVDNNIVSNPDARGIDIVYGSNCTISNNTVTGANHSGIFTYSTNCLITDNKVNDTFIFNNIGISGSGSWYMGSGICVEGDDNLIKYNRVISAGYNGISFSKRNIVEYNYIKNVLLTKDDGGGIYAASAGSYPNAATAGSIIRNNIVDGVFGTLEGWDTWILRGGHGIFLDENGGGVTIENNIVANCTGTCVFLHKSFNETIKNNLLFNARRGFAINQDLGGSQFKNNIIYVLKKDIDNKGIEYLVSKYQGNVEINNNTYISHYNSTNVFMLEEVKSYDFNGWKTVTGQDANSTIDLSPLPIGDIEEIFYNDTKQTKTFSLGNSIYYDIYGKQITQSITLEPFTSKILIKTSSTIVSDTTPPSISSFIIPSTSLSLSVHINNFTATDDISVTGYLITESSSAPNASITSWSTIAPTLYNFTSEGTKTLYSWTKDAAGNVSKSISKQVVITLSAGNTKLLGNSQVSNLVSTIANRRAMPVTFSENGTIESISIYHNGGAGNILMGIYSNMSSSPSNQLGVTASATISSTEGWQTVSLTNPVLVTSGQTVWLSWVFQNNPGIRYATGTPGRAQSSETWAAGMPSTFGTSTFEDYIYSIYCSYTPGIATDIIKPVVSAFTIPTTSSSLIVSVSSFTATDNIDITGYLLTENSTVPTTGISGWTATAPTSYSFSTEGTKTLYAWTKDAAGNISASKSAQVVITLPDITKPVISSFTIPTTSSSLIVSVSSFTASDNIAVTGYLLTENSTVPTAGNSGWNTTAPTSYSFTSEGTKTLYAWTKDAAGNISASKSAQVVITLPDTTKPVVSAFTIPATSSSLIVSVSSFTATDNKAVTGYLLTENSTVPTAGNSGWNTTAPTSYSFTSEGTKTLYAWTKDAAGNISASKSAQVVITLPDVTKPVIISFSIPETTELLTIPITSFDAVDDKEVTGYMLTETESCPLVGSSCWTTSAPTTYTFSGEDLINIQSSAMKINEVGLKSGTQITTNYVIETTKTLYAWTKDAAGNISTAETDDILISLPDVEIPYITSFSLPTISASLTVSISNFEASDNTSVTGYLLTESSTVPDIEDKSWDISVPTSYSFTSEGTKTLYAWVKDAAGNVSESISAQIVITLPDTTRPIISTFTISTTSSSLIVTVNSFTATDNKAVTGYLLTENSTVPTSVNSGWNANAPTSFTFSTEGTKTLYAWSKDADGNVSASKSAQVVITLPDTTKPVVSAFTIPTTSSSLIVSVSSFTATDNIAVTGYLLTENSTVPTTGNSEWNATVPSSYSFSTEGTKTIYAWTKDAAGNISSSKNATVIISLQSSNTYLTGITEVLGLVSTVDNRRAMPVTFTENATIESLSIYHNGGTGNMILGIYSDQSDTPASLLGVTLSTQLNTSEGWQTISLISPASVRSGQKVWLSWVFQKNPGIRYSIGSPARAQSDNLWLSGMPSDFGKSSFANYKYSIYCSYTIDSTISVQPDVTKPTITSFNIPATSTSLNVAVSSLIATDNIAVTGYKLTESATAPLADDAGWNVSLPDSYSFASEGIKTLYAWAKDAAGNVSANVGKEVVITFPITIELPEEQLITQSIQLKTGWNIFSSFVEPTNESMDSIMENLQLNEDLNYVQDKVCNTYEKCPITYNWINNIGNLQISEGYIIKVESDCFLEITGKQIELPFSIQIKRGWNIISFPIDGSIDAMKVVQPLIDAGVIYKIQDERGYSIENWRNLGWKNGIGNFNSGEGYILQANKNGVLTINDLSSKSSFNFAERSETTNFKVCYEGNGNNHMNINLVELTETNLQVGDEIAAFDGEICVGAIKLTEFDLNNNAVGIAVSASELNETTGFTVGNQIELKVWKNENGQESNAQPLVIEGEMIFNKQASVFVSLNNQSTNVNDMFDNLKIDMYPNPASDNVTIRFSALPAEGTQIKLMDILGNEILSHVVQNTQETLNIQDLPVGMYLIKTELHNNYRIQKLIKK